MPRVPLLEEEEEEEEGEEEEEEEEEEQQQQQQQAAARLLWVMTGLFACCADAGSRTRVVARALGGDGSMCGRAIVLRRRQVQVRANGYGFSRAVVYLQFGYRYRRPP